MIISAKRLLRFIPPSLDSETVEACRVMVHFNLHDRMHRYSVTLPDGRIVRGACQTEPEAVQWAAHAIASWAGAWKAVAS